MNFKHFKAGMDDSGRRLDRVLRRFLSEENLSSIYKSLRKGLIKVDGKKCDGNFRVSEGSDLQIADFLLDQKETIDRSEKTKSPLLDDITLFKNDFISRAAFFYIKGQIPGRNRSGRISIFPRNGFTFL